MSGFSGLPIKLELIPLGKRIWRLHEPLTYISRGFKIPVPAGWVTDLTSKPQVIFWIKKEAEHTPASIIHDWCYAKGYILSKDKEIKIPISRHTADKIYLQCMKELGVPSTRRNQIYWGVRLGGWASWKKYRST